MAASAYKSEVDSSLTEQSWNYLWRKIKSIFPSYLTAYILSLIVYTVCFSYDLKTICDYLKNSLFQITMLEMVGNQHVGFYLNGTWYISAMIVAMAVLFPVLKKNFDFFISVISPIILILFFSFGFQNIGCLNMIINPVWIVYDGLFRAIAEISLGCICFVITLKLRNIEIRNQKSIITIVGSCCYVISIVYMYFDGNSTFDYTVLILLAVALICTFSEKGYIYYIMSKSSYVARVTRYLGKISLSIYLLHLLFVQIVIPIYFSTLSYKAKIGLYILMVLLASVLFDFFVSHVFAGRRRDRR